MIRARCDTTKSTERSAISCSYCDSLAIAADVTEPVDRARFGTREHAEHFAKELAVEVTANCAAAAVAFPLYGTR